MDALRLSLLIFGALAIGGVYLWTSHLQHKKRQQRAGWEGPDSAVIPNVHLDSSAISPDSQDYHFIPDHDHQPELGKVFTQDVDNENLGFNDTGEFRSLSQEINETQESREAAEVPSVFVKPKVYRSELDETKSHIKAVQERERIKQREQRTQSNNAGLVIVINIMARPGLEFKGELVKSALTHAGFKFGDMDIFHKPQETDSGDNTSLFSLSNIVNPGTFDMKNISSLKTPGLSLFMQLPGPQDGLKTFEKMLNTAQNIKKELDGELCDETRSALTYQTISHIKERIKEYSFKYQQA